MEQQKRTFLVLIRFSQENLAIRLREAAPKLNEYFRRISGDEFKMPFTLDGATVVFLLNTDKPLKIIRSELYGNAQGSTKGAILLNGDSYFVVGLSAEYDGMGFSNGWAWLQHHLKAG